MSLDIVIDLITQSKTVIEDKIPSQSEENQIYLKEQVSRLETELARLNFENEKEKERINLANELNKNLLDLEKMVNNSNLTDFSGQTSKINENLSQLLQNVSIKFKVI